MCIRDRQQSDDILRLLPPELATLGITDLEFEFYRKLVEKQLLTYRLHGDAWREKITERPVTRQDVDEQDVYKRQKCIQRTGTDISVYHADSRQRYCWQRLLIISAHRLVFSFIKQMCA